MNTRIIFLAAVSLAAFGALGCSADVAADDHGTVEDDVRSSKQRTTFAGVSVGFGDRASRVLSKLQAKGLDAGMTEILGYGPALTAVDSEGTKLVALAAGGEIGVRITVESDDYKLDIRDNGQTETLRNGRVTVPSDVSTALANNAMKFGSVSVELGSPIKDAAEAMGTIVRQQDNYGTSQFIFDFQHNGDPVAVTAMTDGKIHAIEIVHTVVTGARSRPIITTTRFVSGLPGGEGKGSAFNRVNDREGKEETYWKNGESTVSISTPFN